MEEVRRSVLASTLYSLTAVFIAVGLELDRSRPLPLPAVTIHWGSMLMLLLMMVIVVLPLLQVGRSPGAGKPWAKVEKGGRRLMAIALVAVYLAAIALIVMVWASRAREGGPQQPLNTSAQGGAPIPFGVPPVNVSAGSGVVNAVSVEVGVPLDRGLILQLLLFSGLVSMAILVVQALRGWKPAVEEGGGREVVEAARASLSMLSDGGDPRLAVILYFAQLCDLLESRGVDVGEEFTAREVADHALAMWPAIPREPLYRLVELFEEARYSTHAITDSYRGEAVACLTRISESLAVTAG